MKKTTDRVPATVELARKVAGYRSHPNRQSVFGREVGYPGQHWAGSFIHETLREAGLLETAFVSTTAALAWFVKHDRVFTESPEPGDIVFYAFPSEGTFDQPHVGLVTETVHFDDAGEFRALEGETASGLARGNQDSDGVFERTRYEPDIVGFVRPREPRPIDLTGLPDPSELPTVRPSNFSKRSSLRTGATVAVQRALFYATGVGKMPYGDWDGMTRSAFEQFLRTVGVYEEIGDVPSDLQLHLLGEYTQNRFFLTPEIPA